MPKLTLRRAMLAAAAIGLLLSPAPAQDKPPLKTIPIVDRDPFTNTIPGNPEFRKRPTQTTAPSKTQEATMSSQQSTPDQASEVVNAPEVRITGIVSNSQGRQAILTTNTQTLIVSVGQKIGDYRISSITPVSVTLSYHGRDHKITMNSAL